MKYLALKTDQGLAELSIVDGTGQILSEEKWQADRTLARDLLTHLTELLKFAELEWSSLDGLIVFRGPGSFTGLRIGITVMNTIAYAEKIPVVGTTGEDWLGIGIERLQHEDANNNHIVLPEYGAEPQITKPRK